VRQEIFTQEELSGSSFFIFCPEYLAACRKDEWGQKINPANGGINNRIPSRQGGTVRLVIWTIFGIII